jgi:hypothetical protein
VNFMNIFSLNVQSLVPKLVELHSFLLPSIFHVLAFSETWLKSSHSNELVSFEGFSIFRCDRFRATHGGVALCINKCFIATLVEKSRAGVSRTVLCWCVCSCGLCLQPRQTQLW